MHLNKIVSAATLLSIVAMSSISQVNAAPPTVAGASEVDGLIKSAVRPMATLETVYGPLSEKEQNAPDTEDISPEKMRKIHSENDRIRKARWHLAKEIATNKKGGFGFSGVQTLI